MNVYDPYDDDAHRAEAIARAAQERTNHRLRLFQARRPAAFAAPGELDPQVRYWLNTYLDGHHGSLILTGNIGTGKTWTLWKLAETLIRSGWTGRFDIAAFHEVKTAASLPIDRAQLRAWADADLFALDEVGAQGVNGWDADALSIVLDTRWQHRRPTLITSNEADLKGILGERTTSRLADGVSLVRFTGNDRRRSQP